MQKDIFRLLQMRKRNITYIFVFLIIFALASCKQKNSGIDTVTVDLEKLQSVSFFDIFSQIEIIPLETNDNSLIKDIMKIALFEDKLYVLDYSKSELLIFNSKGNFLTKISDRGQGPDQYLNIADFDVDTINRRITLLAPINSSIYEYDLYGNFEAKHKLPTITGAYNRFKCLNNDTIVFWNFDESNRIKFYSKSQNAILKESYPEKDNILNNFTPFVFPYENYFCRSSDNVVYEITNNCEITAKYKWDFMRLNNSEKTIRNFEAIPSSELRNYTNRILSSEEINYILSLHGGTSKYYFTQLWRKNKRMNVFFDKVKNIQYVFNKTTENANFYPLTWTNEYVIGFYSDLLGPIDETLPDAILNSQARKIKESITEYDNPVLIIYYFNS